ncbi:MULTISPECIES: hypothetical protein [Streptomyces]|uniref:Uncharacterized protein n=1 Tax=Streptomyces sudanensis TaxID=436397 RepID=A0ABY4TCT4_9ACTN|nr:MULTISPECIES: hypothetical protein [Streptomyces]URN14627.1 hypothetical protein MW084_00385 [Streptomyces sudanensis]
MPQRPAAPASPTAPDRAALRAERRRLREAVQAKRSLLRKRAAFEKAEERRRFTASASRAQAIRTHQAALAAADRDRQREQQAVAAELRALDDGRQDSEARELRLLRQQFIDRALRRAHLSARELNGLGTGLINDLAARGIRTAADFTGVERGTAPNGKGGEAVWIRLANGHRVHINGIGEHRAKVLVEWRRSCVRRAEERAPKRITPADRRRIEEASKRRRAELEARRASAESVADEARAEAGGILEAALARLAETDRAAARAAAVQRARYDILAEELSSLERQLEESYAAHGDLGFLSRWGTRRTRPAPPAPAPNPSVRKPPTHALRPQTSAAPPPPEPAPPGEPEASPMGAGARRPGLWWLVPVVFYLVSVPTGTPVLVGAPPRVAALLGAGHLLVSAYVFGLWVRSRRRWRNRRTAARMPKSAHVAIWTWPAIAVSIAAQYA